VRQGIAGKVGLTAGECEEEECKPSGGWTPPPPPPTDRTILAQESWFNNINNKLPRANEDMASNQNKARGLL